ncbi:proline and serine-rich protein 2 isoform X2 [Protopterus annectens]|uniref:proline and serine-rich protein 2 isoform X2 n=1 Tax=Protopterus annectens TaxID=7888 RepID=UPI001CFABDC6|nr:proline and serine-rich protein 2 isoform X2 [Protopterus annectens]
MDYIMTAKPVLNDIGRNGSSESRGSSLRSRSSSYDDESLNFLTHEEKDVLMFFEETLDSFEDEEKEEGITDYNDNSVAHFAVPRLVEENGLNHYDNEDIIDLVQSKTVYSTDRVPYDNILPDHEKTLEVKTLDDETLAVISDVSLLHEIDGNIRVISPIRDITVPPDDVKTVETVIPKNNENHLPESGLDQPKPDLGQNLGFVPTPVVVAQKWTEKQNEKPSSQVLSKIQKGNEYTFLHPTFHPHALSHGRDFSFRHGPQSPPKIHRFPENINVTVTGKEYNKTIAKAAVRVQERRAQMLANLNGAAFLSPELDEKAHSSMVDGRVRSASFRDQAADYSRHGASSNPGLATEATSSPDISNHIPISSTPKATPPNHFRPNGHESVNNNRENLSTPIKCASDASLSTAKSVVFKPDPDSAQNKISRSTTAQSIYARSPISSKDSQRACSLPRQPTGLRPQGITVQFSGRGASEESRKEALRKLGLLKSS